MEEKFKVGIVGYGWAATAHIAAINSSTNAQVSAVCSSRDLDSETLSKEHGSEIKAYSNLDDMLADPDLDAVSITSYPASHLEQAVAAAKAGKHIILEKPVALTLDDCRAIESAINEAGVKTCVCFELRFISQFIKTKELIDEGVLGKIHYGEIDYYHGIGPWYGQYRWNTTRAQGGSSLLSAGCHALDALLLCMDGEVEEVTAYETFSENPIFKKYEYATTTVTILKFTDGRIAKCASVIDCLQPYYFHTHLVGSEGTLLDNKLCSNVDLEQGSREWQELPMSLADSGDVADHPYATQFQAFFDALEKGEDMPRTSLGEAMKTFEVLFAADLSASEGRPVKISELRG